MDGRDANGERERRDPREGNDAWQDDPAESSSSLNPPRWPVA